MLKDFKSFVLRGNVVDLAVGVVIGAAFAAVVTAFTEGLISPLIGLFGSASFDTLDVCLKGPCGVDAATGDPIGSSLQYGRVLTALLTFLITAAVVYFFVVRPVNALMDRRRTEPEVDSTTKQCAECLSSIPAAARRCAFCAVEQRA
ncbi:MAG TPA: large conductance mechanosensitive channel protein MscL [Frankiaceae bacterium]|jgi:large conductance mechanosensitive channel|nr:large conductance mechanosensitive channel protein MscL [Frankiaceae bacterium]